MMRAMPSFSASRLACSGAAPPNATSVRSPIATPRSTACTRAALAMFSSTISATATAACSAAMPASFAPDPRCERALGLGHIDRDLAAGEARRVDLADHQVGVRHGRLGAAAAVAGGPRLGAGAVGPDQDALQGIDAGNRAAAGADLHHLDDGDAHGRAAALLEARLAVDLEHARLQRLAVVDQADLGGGAAHVERQDAALAPLQRDAPGQDGAAGGSGLHQADGEAGRRLEARQAAARGHQVDGLAEPELAHLAREPAADSPT